MHTVCTTSDAFSHFKTFGGKTVLLSNHLQHIFNQQRETNDDFFHNLHSKDAKEPLMPVGINGVTQTPHSRSNTIPRCLQLGGLNSRSLLLSFSL